MKRAKLVCTREWCSEWYLHAPVSGYTAHDQAGCEKMNQEKIIAEPLLENILKQKMMRALILVFDESVVRYKQQGCA
jgi:hypothetical protein